MYALSAGRVERVLNFRTKRSGNLLFKAAILIIVPQPSDASGLPELFVDSPSVVIHFRHPQSTVGAKVDRYRVGDDRFCGRDCNFEALSYMLRGFFEGLRRHIAFEVEHLMPILDSD